MTTEMKGLNGAIGKLPAPGTVADGVVISMTSGRAIDYMTVDNCKDRLTDPETPFINIEIGIAEYGVINNTTFRDYAITPDAVVSPNTMHGRVKTTYPKIAKDEKVKMIASKKERGESSIIIWKLVTV